MSAGGRTGAGLVCSLGMMITELGGLELFACGHSVGVGAIVYLCPVGRSAGAFVAVAKLDSKKVCWRDPAYVPFNSDILHSEWWRENFLMCSYRCAGWV